MSKAIWNSRLDECLLILILEHQRAEGVAKKSFKKPVWFTFVEKFNKANKKSYDETQLKTRFYAASTMLSLYSCQLIHVLFIAPFPLDQHGHSV